eukprot:IDg22757t1
MHCWVPKTVPMCITVQCGSVIESSTMNSSSLPDPLRILAREHYARNICKHAQCLGVPDAESISYSFALMAEDIRIDTVRCMLLCLTAPPGAKNILMHGSLDTFHDRKRARRENEERSNCTSLYAIRGIDICRDAFLAITQICSATLAAHSLEVATSSNFE